MKTLIIVPAFNEARVIGSVIKGIRKKLKTADVVVVDDGSSDKTFEVAKKEKVIVIKHLVNRGLGGAIGTGLKYACKFNYDVVVTMDADGQHDPNDLSKMIKPVVLGRADVVIGSRVKKRTYQIPIDRRIMIRIANLITFVMFGFVTTDSISGLRAFSKKAMRKIELKTQAMEVSNEIFSQIGKHKLKYEEVPIVVKYTKYSRSKGQKNLNAFNVGIKLLLRLAR